MLIRKNVSQVGVEDEEIARVQTNITEAVDAVMATPILDGLLVQRVVIPTSGKLTVSHKLGRAAAGVMVVMASAAVSVPYALAADQTAPNGAIVLTFSTGAGATISLWVF